LLYFQSPWGSSKNYHDSQAVPCHGEDAVPWISLGGKPTSRSALGRTPSASRGVSALRVKVPSGEKLLWNMKHWDLTNETCDLEFNGLA
jgi:hypothetical protein